MSNFTFAAAARLRATATAIPGRLRATMADRRGIAAVFFALSVPVLLGAVAFAVDFTNYRVVRSRLQAAADAAAIAGVKALDAPADTVPQARAFAQANVPDSYGDVTLDSDVQIGVFAPGAGFAPAGGAGGAVRPNAVRVQAVRSVARGNAARRLLFAFWGPEEMSLSAVATAARQLNIQYEPPEGTWPDPSAWDFNEIWAYCYDRNASGPAASRRSNMTLIGSNWDQKRKNSKGQTVDRGDVRDASNGYITEVAAQPPEWPKCSEQGQALSFRLRNIREANEDPSKFRNAQEYNYFTDTVISGGVESFSGLPEPMVETVRCDSRDACDTGKRGNIIPSGSNRNPNLETKPCAPDKYMYFGWEDRPRASGSDRDYDDIRLIMKCPSEGYLGDGITRLVG